MTSHRIITIRPEGNRFIAYVDDERVCISFFAQQDAERFADGLAYGLRLAGYEVRIDIDVPDETPMTIEGAMGRSPLVPTEGELREEREGLEPCDVPFNDDAIDFAMLDTPASASARPAKAATAPERDAVEARLERDGVANFYRAAHLERQGRGF